MSTFVTHPSVRIKGTENNYAPVTCTDMTCIHRQNIHWHCPFCSCTESFNDVVILKAHYRVKHVDKGIEFAGLKVLRCCDTCDIVGAIKGEKKFKGAHWHCYRCRNGFNRRDEAIKHYRTHFRNPQTTFQIQIAQEVNHPNVYQEVETQMTTNNLECDEHVHSVIPENVEIAASTQFSVEAVTERASSLPEMQVSVAANETVNSTPQAIMLIQGGNLIQSTASNSTDFHVNSNNFEGGDYGNGHNDKCLDKRYSELQAKYQEAVEGKARLTMTVEELKLEMQVHMQEVARYQKREEELLNQLSIPLDKSIQDLLKQLETQHRELLYHQLAHIKRTYPSAHADRNRAEREETPPTPSQKLSRGESDDGEASNGSLMAYHNTSDVSDVVGGSDTVEQRSIGEEAGRVDMATCGGVDVGRVDIATCGDVDVGRVDMATCGVVDVGRVDMATCGDVDVGRVDMATCGGVDIGRVDIATCGGVDVSRVDMATCDDVDVGRFNMATSSGEEMGGSNGGGGFSRVEVSYRGDDSVHGNVQDKGDDYIGDDQLKAEVVDKHICGDNEAILRESIGLREDFCVKGDAESDPRVDSDTRVDQDVAQFVTMNGEKHGPDDVDVGEDECGDAKVRRASKRRKLT